MGKGDKKTKRGKIVLGTYGVRRRAKTKKTVTNAVKTEPKKIEKAPEPRIVPPRKKLRTTTNQ